MSRTTKTRRRTPNSRLSRLHAIVNSRTWVAMFVSLMIAIVGLTAVVASYAATIANN